MYRLICSIFHMMDIIHIGKKATLEVPADLFFSASVRDFGLDMFKLSGFNIDWQSRLKLLIDELFMNAVKYGSSESSNVYLSFEILKDGISFCIEDTGTGKQGCSARELQEIIEEHKKDTRITKTSGRGLSMFIKNWSDDFRVEESEYGGIKIIFVKHVQKEDGLHSDDVIKISKDKKSRQVSIVFSGEIDQFSLEKNISPVQKLLDKKISDTELIFDFDKVTYINSTFIGYLASIYTTLDSRNSRFKIINVNHTIFQVLTLVGLSKIVEVQKKKSS